MVPVIGLIFGIMHIIWLWFMIITGYWAYQFYGTLEMAAIFMGIVAIPLYGVQFIIFWMFGGSFSPAPALTISSIAMIFMLLAFTSGPLSLYKNVRSSYRLGVYVLNDPTMCKKLEVKKGMSPYDAWGKLNLEIAHGLFGEAYENSEWKAAEEWFKEHEATEEPKELAALKGRWAKYQQDSDRFDAELAANKLAEANRLAEVEKKATAAPETVIIPNPLAPLPNPSAIRRPSRYDTRTSSDDVGY